MKHVEYDRMFRFESQHFWFRGTRAVIRDALDRSGARPGAGRARVRLLDVGCGTGSFLAGLSERYAPMGLDLHVPALRYTQTRGPWPLIAGSADRLPLADGSLDAVTALDVIEHLDDDRGVVSELARVLRPGGVAVATVPAFQRLWSPHDEALGHKRRYRLEAFERLFTEAGLSVTRLSYYNTLLFPPIALMRLARRRVDRGESSTDLFALPGPINRALATLLGAERHVLARARLPFGVSLIGTFTKPDPCT
jgi:SAM-dependent methyltransferase